MKTKDGHKAHKSKCPRCGKPRLVRQSRVGKLCRSCSNSENHKSRNQVGEKNGSWKGGFTYHTKGYRMLRVATGEKLPTGNLKYGYVFEHILVMEEVLGRMLAKHENVHHKNGVKDDNRIENLELWAVAHPSGQRVTDLVEWVVRMYPEACGHPTDDSLS